MTLRIINFLEAIAPLARAPIDLEYILILSYIESYWKREKNIQVNDVVEGISNLSTSTVHRRLRKFRQSKILIQSNSENDNRIKFIRKGPNYQAFQEQIEKLYESKSKLFSREL